MRRVLAVFFGFGAAMCVLTIILLTAPGTRLDWLWRLNADARLGFQLLGTTAAVAVMFVVGVACASAAIGLWNAFPWGSRLAITILSLNILGDLVNAFMRHDYRTLIGLPVGGAMILYLIRARNYRMNDT